MSSAVRRCSLPLSRYFLRNNGNLKKLATLGCIYEYPRYVESAQRSTSHMNIRMAHSAAQNNWITTRDESREMMAVWPDIVRDLTETGCYPEIPEVTKWLAKVLQYNVPGGKKTRGLTVVYAFMKLAPADQLTEENIRLARILGWCAEMCQAFLVVMDDIMDQSTVRRNQPCWHLYSNVGLGAINDGILIEHTIFELLRIHFKNRECYLDLIETFHDNILKTSMGQALDLSSTEYGKRPNLNLFTMDRYNNITKYKTAYYTLVMPVILAMHLAGVKDLEMRRQAKTILLEIGNYMQIQDDYLDCYADKEMITKTADSDIKNGKCSWLAVVALQRATPQQRQIMEECYGYDDPEKVKRVKQLYNELGLQSTFQIYEEETYELITTHIQQISRGLPHDLFFNILKTFYRRKC